MELKESNFKPKKSILNAFLVKRSSKVEPHPTTGNGNVGAATDNDESANSMANGRHTNPFHHASVSANSTPIKRLYNIGKLNKIWRCYYSTQSVNSSTDTAYPSTSVLRRKKTKEHRNRDDRHSHPIRATQQNGKLFDKVASVSGGYSDYELFCNDQASGRLEATGHRSPTDSNDNDESTVFKSAVEVHKYYDDTNMFGDVAPFHGSSSRSGDDESSQSPKSPASNSQDVFFTKRDTAFGIDRPVPSIAMSACRSRLRQKLLPPSSSVDGTSMQREQNLSFPNISDKDKLIDAPATQQHRNSRSYSYDMLSNAKRTGKTEALAKNSLMAAQLINLIPTEVARERYMATSPPSPLPSSSISSSHTRLVWCL